MKLGTTLTAIVLLFSAVIMFILAFGCFLNGAILQGISCILVFFVLGIDGIIKFMESGEPKKPNI